MSLNMLFLAGIAVWVVNSKLLQVERATEMQRNLTRASLSPVHHASIHVH